MKMFKLPADLHQWLINYLNQRPYREAVEPINGLLMLEELSEEPVTVAPKSKGK